MQIDLPDTVVSAAEALAAAGVAATAEDVIARAIEALRVDLQEVLVGIDAYNAGDFRPLEDFGRDLRDCFGVTLPEA